MTLPTAATGAEPGRGSRVQSVDRAARLMTAVAESSGEGSTATLLAETCGLNRATAWRILSTLADHGLVSCDRETGRWSVGVALLEMARTAGVRSIVQLAQSALGRLSGQSGETAALALLRNGELTYVDEVAPTAIVAATWRGRTVPLHATSTGKVVLAYSDAATASRLVGRALRRYTATTITDLPTLEAELDVIRDSGYATCRGEYEESAWGVSAPVLDSFGRPLAVLSIWGPGNRVTAERFEPLGTLVAEAARSVFVP